MKRFVLITALLLLSPPASRPAWAEDALFTLSGPDGADKPITRTELAALPSQRVHVTFLTGGGEETADYEGVLLWDLLERQDVIPAGAVKDHVRLVVRVVGRDKYVAAVAVGEIEPDFEAKEVLLGHQVGDTGPHAGELRLVVPGDKHGARNVRDVARVEVR